MSRPLLVALEAQQKLIDDLTKKVAAQDLQITYIAKLAGIGDRVAAIQQKVADIDNPGQPVPNPPSEPASESTEEAVKPEAQDDVRNPGMTPGSTQNVAADTTDIAMNPGTSLPTEPYNELLNVSAPVSGTETQLPLNQTRIETDVRVGDPMNPEIAFPWNTNMGPNNSNGRSASRTMKSIRLARLLIEAGVESGDDLEVATKIEASKATDDELDIRTSTLERVKTATAKSRPANLVPKAATKAAPSLSPTTSISRTSGIATDDMTQDSDLFM